MYFNPHLIQELNFPCGRQFQMNETTKQINEHAIKAFIC